MDRPPRRRRGNGRVMRTERQNGLVPRHVIRSAARGNENAVRFWGEVNPAFFKGTAVEKQAADVLQSGAAHVRR